MKLADIEYTCECIAGISTIPIRIYERAHLLQSYGLENFSMDPVSLYEEILLTYEESVSYYSTPFYQFYGIVKHHSFTIILGPIGRTDYTQQEKRDYAFALGLSPIDFDPLLSAMRQIPVFTPDNFLHLLLLINHYFNDTKKDISEVMPYLQLAQNHTFVTAQRETVASTSDIHEMPPHNTRSYEKEMLNFVREGDVNGLNDFFSSRRYGRVGITSHEQIRQQKNLFIVAVTLVSRAAIDGGLYEEEAYSLSDMYIHRCEELFSLEAIIQLSYEMAIDFTKRVFSIDARTSLSPLVASVVTYIRSNISTDLSCATLADHFSIHRNQLSKKFKEDTGKTLSEFVMYEKIRRAKNLLAGTDKSFSEISYYLGFSSQSHFQTTFKRFTNQTLKEYREHFLNS